MATTSEMPSTALALVLQRWRRRAGYTLAVLLAVCFGIALLLTALDGGRFAVRLTYALCIGSACTLVNDLSWFAQAALHDRLRHWRGLPPSPGPYVRGWTGTLPAVAMCLLLGPPLGQAAADAWFGFRSPSLLDFSSGGARVTLTISLLATVVLVVIVSAAERLAAARAEAETSRRQAAEHQLRLLQSQLEPHMLFNTLANLRVLIGLDAPRAQAMLDRLVAYLRATLAASRQPLHPLADEFARLDDYLALMAVRMGSRLQVQLRLPSELAALPVPPLLLQPLVENSIQHGLEPHLQGGRVEVRARREGALLVLEVEDDGAGLPPPGATAGGTGSGFGLAGIRERLATLYGIAGQLQLSPGANGQGTLARVQLPITPLQRSAETRPQAALPAHQQAPHQP